MVRLRSTNWQYCWTASLVLLFASARTGVADAPTYESPEIGKAIELLRQNGASVSFYPTQFFPILNRGREQQPVSYSINIHSLKPTTENLSALLVIPKVDRLTVGPNFQRDQATWDTLAQMSEVVQVAISGDLQEFDLANVARYPNLNQLTLSRANNLQPQEFWYLEEAAELRRLSLSIDGECQPYFEYLSRLPQLTELSLSLPTGHPVTLNGIEKLDQLDTLSIDAQQVRGSDLSAIGKMPQLNSLSLMRTFLAPDDMEIFRSLDRLTTLTMYDCHFKDSPVEPLENLTALVRANFTNNDMNDNVLKPLGKLPRIRMIHIRGSKVTDDGLKHLHKTRTLQTLNISSTNVTQEGLDALRKAIPTLNLIAPLNN